MVKPSVWLFLTATLFGLTAIALKVCSADPADCLEAAWTSTPGGIGIPGLTKTYEAQIANRCVYPVFIEVCDYIDDTLTRGKSVPYMVERWDQGTTTWRVFWAIPSNDFCKAHGTDISSKSTVRGVWLWPKQSVSTGFVAIQGTIGLRLKDLLRFSIAPFGRRRTKIVTPAFEVDELPADSDAPFRVSH